MHCRRGATRSPARRASPARPPRTRTSPAAAAACLRPGKRSPRWPGRRRPGRRSARAGPRSRVSRPRRSRSAGADAHRTAVQTTRARMRRIAHRTRAMHRFKLALLLSLAFSPALAQDLRGWSLDPGALAAGSDLLRRAPDREVDELFQAVHAAARDDDRAPALCALFDPGADRSLEALNAAALELDPASRERFAAAVAGVLVAALQSPPQPWDA